MEKSSWVCYQTQNPHEKETKKIIYIKNKNSITADLSCMYGKNQYNMVIIF